jgi:DNA-binding MarR family transcriptional regulator
VATFRRGLTTSDRRQHILALTKLGKKITRRAITISPMITNEMLGDLTSPERKQIVLLLQKIISGKGKRREIAQSGA